MIRQTNAQPRKRKFLFLFEDRFPHAPALSTVPSGSQSASAAKPRPAGLRELALFAIVEMFITTSTAEFPGVTGVEGLNMHCAPAGSPAVHARLTAPEND